MAQLVVPFVLIHVVGLPDPYHLPYESASFVWFSINHLGIRPVYHMILIANIAVRIMWYWNYEYADFPHINYNSLILNRNFLNAGEFRLLEVDNRIIVPIQTIQLTIIICTCCYVTPCVVLSKLMTMNEDSDRDEKADHVTRARNCWQRRLRMFQVIQSWLQPHDCVIEDVRKQSKTECYCCCHLLIACIPQHIHTYSSIPPTVNQSISTVTATTSWLTTIHIINN